MLLLVNGMKYVRRSILVIRRNASTSKKPSKRYSDTLNLPKTTFPLSMKDGVAARREIDIQKVCGFTELYAWQAASDRKEEFILHDGPPYANGDPHVGHAVNKILKDITNRYKLLRGYKVNYVPGWDCHGLPIEQKALANEEVHYKDLNPLSIRDTAKKFAEKAINRQMSAFKRWGVMADWSNCYYTYDKMYVSRQLEAFYQMYKNGFIYQGYMPVYWSPSSGTALAEAELEYNDNHQSTAVYVKFPITNIGEILRRYFDDDLKIYALIWTTTPWTLIANKAICYNEEMSYALVNDVLSGEVLLMATNTVERISKLIGRELRISSHLEGGCLSGLEYKHPLTGQHYPMLPGHHVTDEKGSGLVHTAPAHGPQDFQVATHHDLPVDCIVDAAGNFMSEAGKDLSGLNVLDAGNEKVLDLLSEYIVHSEIFTHSYPYDWRTKQPTILRASLQWFVNTAKVKNRAMEVLKNVTIIPKSSEQGMLSQLEHRSYWCISRQRVWGVPIPVFYLQENGKPLISRASIDHISKLVQESGPDCWWRLPTEQLLPPAVVEQSGFAADAKFDKGSDVLDIWFDAGSSWFAALGGTPADMYLEGLDQFGGWFQSSLLTSVAIQDEAPYRSIVVHGFAMDEEGKKMSKSIGNVLDPDVVINGSKHQETPAYGADVLRWWVARSGLDSKVYIGPNILDNCNEQLFQMRKVLRYLLGNICDFNPDIMRVNHEEMPVPDKFMLHQLYLLGQKIVESYEAVQYTKVLVTMEKFVNNQVSLYSNITKDRVYCSMRYDVGRRSAQTVQWLLLQAITAYLAPVVPHLAEEVFQHLLYKPVADSYFKTSWFEVDPQWHQPDLDTTFDIILNMRDCFNSVTVSEQPVEFDVVVCAKTDLFDHIKLLQEPMTSSLSSLTEVLQCSSSSVLSIPPLVVPDDSQPIERKYTMKYPDGREEESGYLLIIMPAEDFLCERCRRYTAPKHGCLCSRCTDALGER